MTARSGPDRNLARARPRLVDTLPTAQATSKLEREYPVALVVGASRGLGLLIARELDRAGFRVVIAARQAEGLARAAEQLRADGARVATDVCDVTDNAQVEALVARTETEVGPIEVMVCVAGIIQVGPLESQLRENFVAAIDTMLWGPVNTALAVAPRMRERGQGRIGLITSMGGRISAPHLLPYSTAKFGAVGFSRGLRSELVGTGVSVTSVEPGLMRTGSHLRATFVGDQGREFAWFAAAASLPLLSMDAERAAGRIVRGILAGRAVVTFTPLGVLAPRVDALFPGLTSALLSLTVRLLPNAPGTPESTETMEGWEAAERLPRRTRFLVNRLTGLGRSAAERFNERTGDREPSTRPR
ncbi:MAG TPA: SDR family oxidoreductase [Propionibacteriaceae bacterium]|nr:SDR family oxidoreductase [Propionibacteriaceae bacterium]